MIARHLGNMMDEAVGEGVFPAGALLCARGNEIFFQTAAGEATLDSVFDLASLTKPLATTLAVARLVAAGELDVNTGVGKWLPAFKGEGRDAVTVDMLLRHTSGLPAHRPYFEQIQGKAKPRTVLRELLVQEPLEQVPGKVQLYSDLGFMLLSWLVEEITGKRLDHWVHDEIYQPLGIEELFFIELTSGSRGLVPVDAGRLVPTQDCAWRGRHLVGEVEDENAWAAGGIEGHAGLFGTLGAVHQLCSAILSAVESESGEILPGRLLAKWVKAEKNQTMAAGFDRPVGQKSSAGKFFSQSGFGHLGFTGTSFWMDLVNQKIIILLTNRVNPSRENIRIREFRPKIHDAAHGFFS